MVLHRSAAAALLLAAVAAIPTARASFTLPEAPSARVNDYAGVLSAEAKAGLEQRFARFEQTTGHQAAVAIFSTIEDWPVEDIATKLFDQWKLGTRERNDGILLVLAVQERKARIEVGYGLEGQLPDQLAGRIIQNDMVPFLKDGQYASAILVFEERIETALRRGADQIDRSEARQLSVKFLLIFLIGVLLIRLFVRSTGVTLGHEGVRRSGSWGSGWGGGFGGGFGGGGFSGGGGLSGGGGASGSW